MQTINLLIILSMLTITGVAQPLCFKSSGIDSAMHVIPYLKEKPPVPIKVYEDRAISTKQLLMVSDGVGSCEYPSGIFADTMVTNLAHSLYKGWEVFNMEASLLNSGFHSNLKETLLRNFIGKSVDEYNALLTEYGVDTSKTVSATLVGVTINASKNKSNYTLFQYGDSQMLILRKTKVEKSGVYMLPVFATQAQQWTFNGPFQVRSGDPMMEYDMLVQKIEAQLHDIVLVASDGLFDNLPTSFIAIAINYLLVLVELHAKRYGNLDKFDPETVLNMLVDDYVAIVAQQGSLYHLKLLIDKAANSGRDVSPRLEAYPFLRFPELRTHVEEVLSRYPISDVIDGVTTRQVVEHHFDTLTGLKDEKNGSPSKASADKANENKGGVTQKANVKQQELSFDSGDTDVFDDKKPYTEYDDDEKEQRIANDNDYDADMEDNDVEDEDDETYGVKNNSQSTSASNINIKQQPRSTVTSPAHNINIFSVFKCTVSDFFDFELDDDKPTYSGCVSNILQSLAFDESIVLKHYDTKRITIAVVRAARYLFDKHSHIFSVFSKESAIETSDRYVGMKKDDLSASVGLVVVDTDKGKLEDIDAYVVSRKENIRKEFETYKLGRKRSPVVKFSNKKTEVEENRVL